MLLKNMSLLAVPYRLINRVENRLMGEAIWVKKKTGGLKLLQICIQHILEGVVLVNRCIELILLVRGQQLKIIL